MLNPDDPMAMHLLMQNALGDSRQYQVFSHEEVDDLKKELALLSSKIDATKRKLAIEIKIRDAATSINKLDGPNGREATGDTSSRHHRRSLLSRGSDSGMLTKTDEELAAAARKCEDLAQEIWRLENRSQDIQRLLLEHTAGILQMTHTGTLSNDDNHVCDLAGAMNGRSQVEALEFGLDDRSFYETLDAILDPTGPGSNAAAFAQQTHLIGETQQRLWDLNTRLREAILQINPNRTSLPTPPTPNSIDMVEPENAIHDQMDYMSRGLETIQRSHMETIQNAKQTKTQSEEKLADLNNHLREIVIQGSTGSSPKVPLPPQVSGQGPDAQITFLQGGLNALEQDLRTLRSKAQASHTRSVSHEEKMVRYESTFQGLWARLVAEEEATRKADGETDSVPKEKFSVEAFASKVDLLNTRAAGLVQQKEILSRQIQQQRELNGKSDSEKDAKISSLTQELESAKRNVETVHTDAQIQLAKTKSAHDDVHQELLQTRQQHNQISQELQQTREQHSSMQAVVAAKTAEADKAREEMKEFEGEMVRLQTELTVARAELDGAYGTRAQRAAEVAQHPALMAEVAGLKDELAAAKANCESVNKTNSELSQRVQTLEKELTETISEYEVMTKSSIEFERERENLESIVDGLRDKVESLETELSDRKVSQMGQKSPGVAGDRSSNEKGATSTSVLKNEFKKMMRETRTEHMKVLRVSLHNRSWTSKLTCIPV